MQLYFVRHAQPAWVQDGAGVGDPCLTELGQRQASLLADRLRGRSFDEIWVSPARRAVETAAPVLEALGATPRVLPWLTELRLPDFSGLSVPEMEAFFQGKRKRPVAEWWSGLPGAESTRDFVQRVSTGLDEELTSAGGRCEAFDDHSFWHDLPRERKVLVICHAGTTGCAVSHLMALPQVPWAWERFYLGHAGIAKLRTTPVAHGHVFGLHRFNDTEHLAPDMRTR